jgi:hypothetical protein
LLRVGRSRFFNGWKAKRRFNVNVIEDLRNSDSRKLQATVDLSLNPFRLNPS